MRKVVIPSIVVMLLAGMIVRALVRQPAGELVETTVVSSGRVASTVLASGRIAPHVEVELRPEIAGTVAKIEVRVGDRVSAGDLLMTIEAQSYMADFDEQAARVRIARSAQQLRQSELEHHEAVAARYRQLYAVGAESRERLEDIEQEVRLARVRLQQARQTVQEAAAILDRAKVSLAKSEVRAPRAGVVIDIGVDVGEVVVPGSIVGAGSSLLTIADTSSVIAKVQVEEADIRKVQVGQRAHVYPIAYETESVTGDVVFVAPRAQRFEDRKTQSFEVRIALRQSELDVRPGMSCRVDILTEEKSNALLVPNQAIIRDEEAQPPVDYVFVVDHARARRVPVTLGIASDTHQEILSGVKRGDIVVTGPYTMLRRLRNRDAVAVRTTR